MGVCARYQAAPKESQLTVVKMIIKYVNGTLNFGLWYPFNIDSVVTRYFDLDLAKNLEDCKSTNGGCFYVKNYLVSWHSKKQTSISLSTAEVEYIATASGCAQLLWMKQMLKDYEL